MSFDVNQVREQFPQLNRSVHDRPLVYFDSAASNLKPKMVIQRVQEHYSNEACNVHRGVHHLSDWATTEFEKSREKVANFIGCRSPNEIIFTKGTTDSLNLVANSYCRTFLSEGDEILISEMEHHSNIVPWQLIAEELGLKVKWISVTESGELDWDDFRMKISSKTKIMSLVAVSNTLGTVNDLEKYISLAKENGTTTVVDAAQSVAHLPIDVQKLDCDFLAFSGHKIYGPTGIGVLFGRKELLEKMKPYQGGGAMIHQVGKEKTTYADIPHKFEAGTPHVAGVLGLGAAVEFVEQVGLVNIGQHELELTRAGREVLKSLPNVHLIGESENNSGIISFVAEGIHHQDIGSLLDNMGIAVRTGHHCTQPLMDRFGITGTTRISFSVFNSVNEVEKFGEGLKKTLEMLG